MVAAFDQGMNTDIPSGAPMGTGSLADGEDVVLVLEARALRRRLRLLGRVLKALVVLGLFGSCASIALLPGQGRFQCRSKQSEAKGNLKALYVAEESSRADVDTYSTDPRVIEFTPRGQKLRYTYTILSATKDAFSAEARGTGDMDGDLWTIDEKNALTNVSNSCER